MGILTLTFMKGFYYYALLKEGIRVIVIAVNLLHC